MKLPATAAACANWSPAQAEGWLVQVEPLGMHFGLDRMTRLMAALGEPQRRFRSIHVVGTNGKSSTARMAAAILQRHGLRTGAYLSPHMHTFAERIEVSERQISQQRFASVVESVAAAAERIDAERPEEDRVTQFEALTAAAYLTFAERAVDVAVIEAGLGGRLDATNVIDSDVQVLTSIGLEHTALLGGTHAEIANEKLAVVRRGATLVLGTDLPNDVERLAHSVVARRGARIVRPRRDPRLMPTVPESFQKRNFAVAEAAAEAFLGTLDPAATHRAAAAVRTPGRLDVIGRAPLTVLDAAHNAHGVGALIDALPGLLARYGTSEDAPVVALMSILSDKDADAMLSTLLPHCHALVISGNSSSRARAPGELAARARELSGRPVTVEANPRRALSVARALAGRDGVVLATGSICLAGDLLPRREAGAKPTGWVGRA
jgi:dihydrofolate synthase/folylpolyglutamate synthase